MEAMQITNEMKPAQPEKLVVAHVVREVVDQLDFPQEQGQALQLDISEQVTVWADKHYLRQIVRNLLSNAFKYAPKRTSVIIRAAVSKGVRRETDVPAQVSNSGQDQLLNVVFFVYWPKRWKMLLRPLEANVVRHHRCRSHCYQLGRVDIEPHKGDLFAPHLS